MIGINQQVQLEQSQRLQLTTELLQSISILQMSSLELKELIENELAENPVLEEISDTLEWDNIEADNYEEEFGGIEAYENVELDSYELYSFREKERTHTDSDPIIAAERYAKREDTLQEYLMNQLGVSKVDDSLRQICEYIIYSLGDDGYLRLSLDELAKELSGTGTAAIEEALSLIQSMDPPGVGARSIQECLILQLQAIGQLDETIHRIIEIHLEDIANNKLNAISSALKISKADVQSISDRIKLLEPKPGARFASEKGIGYIVPDVIVEVRDATCSSSVNRGFLPDVRISELYTSMAKERVQDEATKTYLADRIRSARALITGMSHRNETLVKVVNSIIRHQEQFFVPDNKILRPLTMQEIADDLGFNISTISRTVDGKYIQINGRIYAMKYFFGSGIKSTSAADESAAGVSTNTIKERIKEIISGEDKHKPLSDQKVAEFLIAEGVEISRRTVAKYRESMDIPGTSKRRRY